MIRGHSHIWATLRHYLAYTAAGFVVLGGLGAIKSYRPVGVDPANARDFSGADTLGNLAKPHVSLKATPAWAEQLLADISPSNIIEPKLIVREFRSASNASPTINIENTTSTNSAIPANAGTARTRVFEVATHFVKAVEDEDLASVQIDMNLNKDADWQDEFAIGDTPVADALARETQKIIEVQSGDTLFGLLTDAGLSKIEAHDVIGAIDDVFSPRSLRAGQEITLNMASNKTNTTASPQLVSLNIEPNATQNVTLSRDGKGSFVVKAIDKPLLSKRVRVAGHIDSNLFDAARRSGLPVAVIGSLIRTFSFDVDFQRDIQPGDSFEIFYERLETEKGEFAKAGNILFASLTLSGTEIPIYFFDRDGFSEYYNPNGETVRKILLRTPIDGARITSGFGMRQHPLLGYSKMHKGTDFGAPSGTPIYSAGNGTIMEIGWHGDYGNYIRIRHNGQYQTAYAHMSRFNKDLKKGDKVQQGDIIGYVGSTGRSTGPHLHYEVLIGGEQINPAKLKNTGGDKLAGADLKAFKDFVATIDAERVRQAHQQFIAERGLSNTLSCDSTLGCEN